MFSRTCLWSHLVLDVCLLEIFKSVSIHYLWLFCSYFLFLPGSVLEGCTSRRIYPFFFLVAHFIAIMLLVAVSYDLLCFHDLSCNFLFFISNFVDLSTLFFSWWVWLTVYQIYLFKELDFSFIDLCYYFFLYFIYLCYLWFISFY